MNKALKEKRRLAGSMQPTVRIGRSGLTSAVVKEITTQLKKKQGVKIKILGTDRSETKNLSSELAERCSAEVVDVRGNTVTLWRKIKGKEEMGD